MLSIILVNYRSGQLILDCIQSMGAARHNYELIVVDNSAGDGAKELVLAQYPEVCWIDTGYNAGFARANNAGIKASSGTELLLLNSDTLEQNNAIGLCHERFLQMPDYVACGVQLLNVDGSPQISGNYVMKGALNYLMLVPYVGRLVRWVALNAGVAKTNLADAVQPVTDVDWINGAFLMVRKTAVEKAGMLDEDFFLYHEESEWCARLKKAGKLCVFAGLHVIHLEGQSSKEAFESKTRGYSGLSDRKGYQLMLSMFVRLRKELGIGWFLFHLLFHSASIPVVLLSALINAIIHPASFLSVLREASGYTMNLLRCWALVPQILSGRPYFYKVL